MMGFGGSDQVGGEAVQPPQPVPEQNLPEESKETPGESDVKDVKSKKQAKEDDTVDDGEDV